MCATLEENAEEIAFIHSRKVEASWKAPANCLYFSLSEVVYIFVPEAVLHLGVEVTLKPSGRLGVSFP